MLEVRNPKSGVIRVGYPEFFFMTSLHFTVFLLQLYVPALSLLSPSSIYIYLCLYLHIFINIYINRDRYRQMINTQMDRYRQMIEDRYRGRKVGRQIDCWDVRLQEYTKISQTLHCQGLFGNSTPTLFIINGLNCSG